MPGHWVTVRGHRGAQGQAEATLELLALSSAPRSPHHTPPISRAHHRPLLCSCLHLLCPL